MIEINVLASSSKGNASLISCNGTHILLDVGISATRVCKGLAECGLHPKQLTAVLITHEHGDHINGLGQLSKKHELTIYCSRHMSHDIRAKAPTANIQIYETEQPLQIGNIRVTPLSVSHDAVDPHCYLFESGSGTRLGYIADTGRILAPMKRHLQSLDALFIESNYDLEMLNNSGRPMYLVRRIASHFGHLSNEQAADFVQEVQHPALQHIILGHLSQDCNTPERAMRCMKARVEELNLVNTQVHCAPAAYRMPCIQVTKF